MPVFRFWSKGYRHHFYTIDEAEMRTVRDTNPNWKYEGIAFYALPMEDAAAAGVAKVAKRMKSPGLEQLEGLEQLGEGEKGDERGGGCGFAGRPLRACRGVVVTTSDGSDGSAVADGDEETGWSPEKAGGGWVALSFAEPVEVSSVEVVGENLPEGLRVLWSEDAETWEEKQPTAARYVWVSWETEEASPMVREIRLVP